MASILKICMPSVFAPLLLALLLGIPKLGNAAWYRASPIRFRQPSHSPPQTPFPDEIQIIGRHSLTEDGASVQFTATGLSIFARFSGVETVSAALNTGFCGIDDRGSVGFEVWCDGQRVSERGASTFTSASLPTEKGLKDGDVALCTGLDPSEEHNVTLVQNTDSACIVTFGGFGDAKLLQPPGLPDRKVEFFGDSLTSGFSALCNADSMSKSYAAVSCQMMEAQCHMLTHAGFGMYRNCGGETSGTMREMWDRTLIVAEVPKWDFSSWVPDAVVVNLGTNDDVAGRPGKPPAFDAYGAAYLEWLTLAEQQYESKPTFFLACGPEELTFCESVKGVVDSAQAQGIKAVFLDLSDDDHERSHECADHPGIQGHRFLARKVNKAVRDQLMWH